MANVPANAKTAASTTSPSDPHSDGGAAAAKPRKGTRRPPFEVFVFGSFKMKAPVRDDEWKANIKLGQQAMMEVQATLAKPGVKLRVRKGVPLYRADPERPGRLIRRVGDKEDRGIIENGVFKIK